MLCILLLFSFFINPAETSRYNWPLSLEMDHDKQISPHICISMSCGFRPQPLSRQSTATTKANCRPLLPNCQGTTRDVEAARSAKAPLRLQTRSHQSSAATRVCHCYCCLLSMVYLQKTCLDMEQHNTQHKDMSRHAATRHGHVFMSLYILPLFGCAMICLLWRHLKTCFYIFSCSCVLTTCRVECCNILQHVATCRNLYSDTTVAFASHMLRYILS